MKLFYVNKIDVKQNRVVVFVECKQGHTMTDSHIASTAIAQFPNLQLHKCKNAKSVSFTDVLDNTSIPHLFEHIVIDMQISKLPSDSPVVDLFGFTQWENEQNGIARVELTFYDDLVAIECVNNAAEFINSLM